jgi:hypothetical protein
MIDDRRTEKERFERQPFPPLFSGNSIYNPDIFRICPASLKDRNISGSYTGQIRDIHAVTMLSPCSHPTVIRLSPGSYQRISVGVILYWAKIGWSFIGYLREKEGAPGH